MTIPSGAWHRPSLQDREPRAPAYVVPGLHQSGSTARLGSDEGGKQDAEVNPKKEVGKHGIGVDVYHLRFLYALRRVGLKYQNQE
jgi:hypothetical protein